VLPSFSTDGAYGATNLLGPRCFTSACANSAMLTGMKTETPRPTLDQLRRGPWCASTACTASWRRSSRLSSAALCGLHQVRPQGRGVSAPELGRAVILGLSRSRRAACLLHVANRRRKCLLQSRVSTDGECFSVQEQAPQSVTATARTRLLSEVRALSGRGRFATRPRPSVLR
jgi:hypothetical protein